MKLLLIILTIASLSMLYKVFTPQTYISGGSIIGVPAQAQTVTETANPGLVSSPPFVRTPHEIQTSVCKHARTGEYYRGLLITAEETKASLLEAGFNQDQARIMVAISHAESGSDLLCWGDETITDNTWRESYGLYQIRLLKNPGSGCRNYDLLKDDILAQSKCAKQIFDGQGFNAWSVFSNGKYKKWLDQSW